MPRRDEYRYNSCVITSIKARDLAQKLARRQIFSRFVNDMLILYTNDYLKIYDKANKNLEKDLTRMKALKNFDLELARLREKQEIEKKQIENME